MTLVLVPSLLLAAFAALSPVPSAQSPIDFEVAAGRTAAELSSDSAQIGLAGDGFDRLTVPVLVGGAGPFRFLVDTGSDRTSVSRELVQRLGLAEQARATMHSASGTSRVAMANLPELKAGRRTVRQIRAPMLDAAHIGADGILGIDSLRSERVTFDFRDNKLAIETGDEPAPHDTNAILVRAKRKGGRLIVTDAEIDGVAVRVVLDSGSSLTVGNSALRRRLERRPGLVMHGPIDLVSVTGKALRGELARAGHFDIGGARLERPAIVFAEAHTFRTLDLDGRPAVLLGMNALRAFDQVTIDFARKVVALVVPREEGRNGR